MTDPVYYDPYDVEIDADPYPVFRRLREEAPLYYNEQYDFYALSRYDDVERGLVDRETNISGRGGILELIKAGIEMPPGILIFEDPPTHTIHRGPALAGVHAPAGERARAEDPPVLRREPRPARGRRPVRLRRRPRRADADAGDRHAARHPRAGPGGGPRPGRRAACGPKPGRAAEVLGQLRRRCDVRRVHRLAGRTSLRRRDDAAAAGGVRGRDRDDPPADPRRDPHLRERRRRRRQRDHDAPDRLGGQGAGRAPGSAARARGGSRR